MKKKKRDKVVIFRLRGGGSPVPTSTNHNTTQKVNIFVKTKNVPNVLKCKINHNFFSHKHGVPKQGGGGKIPTFSCYFFWQTSLTWFTNNKVTNIMHPPHPTTPHLAPSRSDSITRVMAFRVGTQCPTILMRCTTM